MMTEQEEAVGRQRLGVLTTFKALLVVKKTDRDVLYPQGNERHARAKKDYDDLAATVARLEVDPFIPLVRILDAEQRVEGATERLAEAQKTLSTHQEAVDKATTEVTEAQAALDALKTA